MEGTTGVKALKWKVQAWCLRNNMGASVAAEVGERTGRSERYCREGAGSEASKEDSSQSNMKER